MKRNSIYVLGALLSVSLTGCSPSTRTVAPPAGTPAADAQADEGHAHDEVELGVVTIGDMEVELAQGHGKVVAGQEGHLVVKLPYTDNGATVVRAWLGSEDRTLSYVGRGEYAASHDDYDIHAAAPATLPEDVRWWIEIQKPDGSKSLGSVQPLMD